MTTDFYITVLGSGAAIPTHARHCSAQVVNVRGFRMLIDCGEGTQDQIRHCHQRLQAIELICISHLHGDHFFGLPGLLSTMHICGRKTPVNIVGPKGIRDVLEAVTSASNSHIEFPINYHELRHPALDDGGSEMVFDGAKCSVHAIALRHSVDTFGYIVEEKPHGQRAPRRYAYCCDTGYFDGLADRVRDVNLLCMESTFANDFAAVAADKLHSTAAQAATVARDANAHELLLTHFSNRYKSLSIFLDEATPIFPSTRTAEDCQSYGVEHRVPQILRL